MRLILAALGLVACVTIGVAAPAQADPATDAVNATFLASLQAAGITYTEPDHAISAGKMVCRLIEMGKSGPEIVAILQARNPALTAERAGQFAAIAARSYCPRDLAGSGPSE